MIFAELSFLLKLIAFMGITRHKSVAPRPLVGSNSEIKNSTSLAFCGCHNYWFNFHFVMRLDKFLLIDFNFIIYA